MNNNDIRVCALIVAAGRGHRLGGALPKQYLGLAGKKILRRTLEPFVGAPFIDGVQCVIHADDEELYAQACDGLDLLPPVHGGHTRQQSVLKGLEALAPHDPDLVLIHDAARPFMSMAHLQEIIVACEEFGAVIPTLPLTDTIKQVDGAVIDTTLDRNSLARAQTPQAFRFKVIYMAHRRQEGHDLTDDAAVAESCGLKVHTIAGLEDNFKITTAEDMIKAQRMIKHTLTDTRSGHGTDVHAFEDGDQVILGGVSIPHTQKLKGHSDADVALHALTDALLGAIAEGDIGSHFPPSDDQWKGASSDIFLRHALKLLQDKGGMISNIDLTIICEAPKIGPHRQAIRQNIAEILDLAVDRISIKATTTEKLGFTGRGEGIAAQAMVLVRLPE